MGDDWFREGPHLRVKDLVRCVRGSRIPFGPEAARRMGWVRGCGAGRDLLWRRQEAPGGTTGTCKSGLETVGRRTRRAAAGRHSRLSPSGQPRHHSLCRIAIAPAPLHTLLDIYTNNTRATAFDATHKNRFRTPRSIVKIFANYVATRHFRFTERSAILHYYIVHMVNYAFRISFESD